LWILEEKVESNLENQRVWQDLNILKDWKYMAEDVRIGNIWQRMSPIIGHSIL